MSGFTLFELMVTLALVAILAAIGVPSMNYLLESSAVENLSYSLMREFSYARHSALNQQRIITTCLSPDRSTCVKSTNVSLISFADNDQNQQFESGKNEQRFSVYQFSANHLAVESNRKSYIFQPDGTVAGTPGTIRICSRYTHQGMEVITALSGRVRMQRVECPEES